MKALRRGNGYRVQESTCEISPAEYTTLVARYTKYVEESELLHKRIGHVSQDTSKKGLRGNFGITTVLKCIHHGFAVN